MHVYPKRVFLEGLEIEIFKLVSYSATPEQWREWLRVPLEHAAARGNLDLFNKLLEAGADGSAGWRGCRDRSLIDAAAVGGNVEVVSGLIDAGAQPDVQVVSCRSKRSALYTAILLGHEDVARRLVIAGADVNFEDPVHKRPVLCEATWAGYEQLVADMLLSGANPSCRDNSSYVASPLHIAASRGLNRIVSTLLFRGADKDALTCRGHTPLIFASVKGRLSVVKTLLAAGADTSIRYNRGYSALDCAAKRGYGDAIEALAEHGADMNACGNNDVTALHVAAVHDHAGAVDALIKAGADVEFKTNRGSTPLAYAAYRKRCKAMHALLQRGAQVDVRDKNGSTPLHFACWSSRKGVEAAVDVLLRWGADETSLDMYGDSPANLLDLEHEEVAVSNPAPQDEIDRTRLLLSRAPADRAWRRRGWLVMLRLRDSKARKRKRSSGGHGDGGEVGGISKMARSDGMTGVGCDGPGETSGGAGGEVEAGGGEEVLEIAAGLLGLEVESVVHTASIDGGVVAGAEGGEESLRLEVLLLLGLGLDGVFRTVVGFL